MSQLFWRTQCPKWGLGPFCLGVRNRNYFGLPPSSIYRCTGLGGNFVWTLNLDVLARAPFASGGENEMFRNFSRRMFGNSYWPLLPRKTRWKNQALITRKKHAHVLFVDTRFVFRRECIALRGHRGDFGIWLNAPPWIGCGGSQAPKYLRLRHSQQLVQDVNHLIRTQS